MRIHKLVVLTCLLGVAWAICVYAATFNENIAVNGTLTATNWSLGVNTVSDGNVTTPAAGANGINTIKLNHRERIRQSEAEGTAVVTQTNIVNIVNGTVGSIVSFKAVLKVACVGGATVTFDLKKNGASVLSSVISFSSSDSALAVKSATISTPACAVGDVFEIVTTATAGGGTVGQGSYAEAIVDEYPS